MNILPSELLGVQPTCPDVDRIVADCDWLRFDGLLVTVDGKRRKMRCYRVNTRVFVSAEIRDHNDPEYREVKARLGDDWTTDVLESEPEVTVRYQMACEAALAKLEAARPEGREMGRRGW